MEAERLQMLEELNADEAQQEVLDNEEKKKLRLASYHAKRGLYFDVGMFEGPFYEGKDICINLLFGGKYFYGGFDVDIALADLTDDYADGAYFEEVPFVTADFILGYSIQFARVFRPYIAAGIGGYMTLLESSESEYYSSLASAGDELKAPSGVAAVGIAGIDLVFKKLVIGGAYKMRYFDGAGFVDNYVVTLGINW